MPALWPGEVATIAPLPALLLFALGPPGRAQTRPPEEGTGEVVVEAERPEGPDPQATSASVTVIPVAERALAADDLGALVEGAPGTAVSRLGGLGDWSAVSIRGSTLRQVLIALDGVPLNPDGASVVNLSELPISAFQRVELYRGSAPPELGASPMGGVVNLVTGDDPPPAASVGMGSFGTQRAMVAAGLRGGALPLDGFGHAELFHTRGDFVYFDDNGTSYNLIDDRRRARANNEKLQASVHARARLGSERLRLTLLDAMLVRDEGLPGHADAPAEAARLNTARHLGVAELSASGARATGLARAWGWLRQEVYDDRAGEIGVGMQWSDDRTSAVGLLGHGRLALAPGVLPALTLAVRRESYASVDLLDGSTDGPRSRLVSTLTLSGMAWLLSERMAIQPQVQATLLDNRDLDGPSTQESPVDQADTTRSARLDPRLGVLLRPVPALAIKANAGSAFRPPDMSELFGDRGAMVGNPELSPERGFNADLGARALLPWEGRVEGSAEATGFWTETRDLITAVQTGQRVLVPVNLGRARARGLEAALDLRGWDHLETRTSLSWTRSTNLSDNPQFEGNQLPRVPEWELSQQTALVWGGPWGGRLGHSYSFIDDNYWDATNIYRAAPRAIHGAFARAALGRTGLSVELDVLNLADHLAEVVPRNPLDPDDDARVVQALTDLNGYPLPGRSFFASLRWSPITRE